MSSMIVGRFAPSPSGLLHVGSLRTALLAWAFARSHGGKIYYRVEDVDTDRARDEIIKQQLLDLVEMGLDFDPYKGQKLIQQSSRSSAYEEAVKKLSSAGKVFWCQCSRKSLATLREEQQFKDGFYPGVCQDVNLSQGPKTSLRYRPNNTQYNFQDLLLGSQKQNPQAYPGAPIIKRSDGLYAYQLAVVTDDIDMGINQVIRGMDIFPQTGVQLSLMADLGGSAPQYGHVPLILNFEQKKFSKSEGALDLRSVLNKNIHISQIIGFYAHSLGLIEEAKKLSIKDFMAVFDPQKITLKSTLLNPQTFEYKTGVDGELFSLASIS
jgi:glutamyl-tRNA synthetase